jgi:5-methylcytosine-specific restriction endonuclease McrA
MTSANFWELAHLSDQGLRHGLRDLIGGRSRIEARVVAHLAAIEERRLHLVDGFSSMFDFCLRQLGLSESEAYHRITAARVARQFPVVFGMIDRGEIHLSAICLLRDHLTEENHLDLLQGASGKTKLKVQELLARQFPKPAVVDSVRKLPSPRATAVPPKVGPSQLPHVAPPEPTRPLRPAKIEPVADAVYKIQFEASRQFKEKLDLARALSSHENPTGKLEVILEQALALWLGKVQKRRFAKTDQPRDPRAARIRLRQPARKREHIANSVRREVAERDELQCTYCSPNGERCAARAFLEFHHEQPWARGGADDSSNLRLLCRAHNRLLAEQDFGRVHLAARIAERRS